jgi:hypothetical protein
VHAKIPDCWLISKLLRFISEYFIEKLDELSWGEASVALWLMIWCAQEAAVKVTIDQILSLSNYDLNIQKGTFQIANQSITHSEGLLELLNCLRGREGAKREQKLFRNLNAKNLERILQEASIAVLGTDAEAVTPSAFLTAPHIFPNIRMSAAQRQTMRNSRRLIDLFPG